MKDDPLPWIVTCHSLEELTTGLAGVEGARLLRPLGSTRAVVSAPRKARAALAALPGVERVDQDTLRHLHGWPSG